jgi:hypothetical protein
MSDLPLGCEKSRESTSGTKVCGRKICEDIRKAREMYHKSIDLCKINHAAVKRNGEKIAKKHKNHDYANKMRNETGIIMNNAALQVYNLAYSKFNGETVTFYDQCAAQKILNYAAAEHQIWIDICKKMNDGIRKSQKKRVVKYQILNDAYDKKRQTEYKLSDLIDNRLDQYGTCDLCDHTDKCYDHCKCNKSDHIYQCNDFHRCYTCDTLYKCDRIYWRDRVYRCDQCDSFYHISM